MSNKIKKNLKDETNIILEQMKKEFAEVNKQMNQRFAEVNKQMKQEFKEVNERLDRHESRLDEHDKKFEEMHRALIIIEDQVTNKIPALFDGYNANHELYEGLEKRVTELEEKESFNSIKISILEDKIG